MSAFQPNRKNTMMNKARFPFIAAITVLATIIAMALPAFPAAAAEPVFPTGSRIGVVPPPRMVASKTFPGFVDTENKAAMLITALPAGGFDQVEQTLSADGLKRQGITLEKREDLQLPVGKAVLVVGTQTAPDKTPYRKWLLLADAHAVTVIVSVQVPQQNKAYPDDVLRASFN